MSEPDPEPSTDLNRGRARLEERLAKLEEKSYLELVTMPLTLAVLTAVASMVLAHLQARHSEILSEAELASAERVAAAQIESAQETARGEQRLKALELHVHRILSPDPEERVLAVRLLAALDPELAERLATAIRDDAAQPDVVRDAAREVEIGTWFAVVKSVYDLGEAETEAAELASRATSYEVHLYEATDTQGRRVYAITLGGYLSLAEAKARARYAIDTGLAADAFWHSTTRWGSNLRGDPSSPSPTDE